MANYTYYKVPQNFSSKLPKQTIISNVGSS